MASRPTGDEMALSTISGAFVLSLSLKRSNAYEEGIQRPPCSITFTPSFLRTHFVRQTEHWLSCYFMSNVSSSSSRTPHSNAVGIHYTEESHERTYVITYSVRSFCQTFTKIGMCRQILVNILNTSLKKTVTLGRTYKTMIRVALDNWFAMCLKRNDKKTQDRNFTGSFARTWNPVSCLTRGAYGDNGDRQAYIWA
jgi:hypothetical protein